MVWLFAGVFFEVLTQNIVAVIRKTDLEENKKEKVSEENGGSYEKEKQLF